MLESDDISGPCVRVAIGFGPTQNVIALLARGPLYRFYTKFLGRAIVRARVGLSYDSLRLRPRSAVCNIPHSRDRSLKRVLVVAPPTTTTTTTHNHNNNTPPHTSWQHTASLTTQPTWHHKAPPPPIHNGVHTTIHDGAHSHQNW